MGKIKEALEQALEQKGRSLRKRGPTYVIIECQRHNRTLNNGRRSVKRKLQRLVTVAVNTPSLSRPV